MKAAAAILAAGAGTRFGGNKISELLGGKPVWMWSYHAFSTHPQIEAAFVVVAPDAVDRMTEQFPGIPFIAGAADRPGSAENALKHCRDRFDYLLIHDAARPFVSAALISRVAEAVERTGAAAPGVPEVDTVRLIEGGSRQVIDRDKLVRMQTPQGARVDLLWTAYALDALTRPTTDDMSFLEGVGTEWELVAGEQDNFKITTREDLVRARRTMNNETRTGLGYDIHPFGTDATRPLMLGGVQFDGEIGLEGHSDADVVLHAAVDALLGAASLGDIGQHFPNTDRRWSGEPSSTFLRETAALLAQDGWTIVNVDVSVIAERPKIMGRGVEMRMAIAEVLGIEVSRVSVKATTNEKLGSLGRAEGIAAFAVATIRS